MSEQLLSVGLDIGTSTTQVVLSRLTLENGANPFSVPRIAITKKEVVYASEIHFTPLLSPTLIDAPAIRALVEEEYRRAGVTGETLHTGAAIITGETARKENAKEVLNALVGLAGDFVVATAGPDLESVLAARGAGIDEYSKDNGVDILHYDIGGGTSNLAFYRRGALADTGCMDVGGRLIKLDTATGVITYITQKIKDKFPALHQGMVATPLTLAPVIDALVNALLQAGGFQAPDGWLTHFITHRTVDLQGTTPLVSFSGGVADCLKEDGGDWRRYGDIGVLLGREIGRRFAAVGAHRVVARETIRATVVGAGSHATQLSGSTIFYRDIVFPIKNLPILKVALQEETPQALAPAIAKRLALYQDEGGQNAIALALVGPKSPSYQWIEGIAAAIRGGLAPLVERGDATVVMVEGDMAKALGHALYPLLPQGKLLCLDGVSGQEGGYLDVMAPAYDGAVLPVVVKTLVL